MKKLIGKWFQSFSQTKTWLWISKKIIAKARLPFPHKFPVEKWAIVAQAIDAWRVSNPLGVVCFSCTDKSSLAAFLVTIITKENYTHSGILFPGWPMTSEMRAFGFAQRNFIDLLKDCDEIGVVGFIAKDVESYNLILDDVAYYKAKNTEYDYEQDLDTWEKLYCSELPYACMKDRVTVELTPTMDFGRVFYSPGDVYNDGELIIEYRNEVFVDEKIRW